MDENENTSTTGQIIVGVDGSASSKAALRWALRQARNTGAGVRAVIAWEVPPRFGIAPDIAASDYARLSRKEIDAVLNDAADDTAGLTVESQVVSGHPAQVLVEAAKGADLLVVGSRGHGALTGLLLGSVHDYCVHHATCPVVVVRGANGVSQ